MYVVYFVHKRRAWTPRARVYHFQSLSTLCSYYFLLLYVTSCYIVHPLELWYPKFRWPVQKYPDYRGCLPECCISPGPCLWGRKCTRGTWLRNLDPCDQLYEHSCTCGVHLVRRRTTFSVASCNVRILSFYVRSEEFPKFLETVRKKIDYTSPRNKGLVSGES